ncbi:MAG: hypothetical protein K9G57_02775 [Ignavibacteriales bacterium]|nr:hypothetical protein [Ignavibacteriales bacterium]MCF8435742.1 hypothetical protein [Ignavibacteriales bacterium]
MEHTNENSFDLSTYRLPEGRRHVTPVIYNPVPGKESGLNFDIYDYNTLFNDPETKKIIRKGDTIGCFYIESPGMRSLLRRLSCDTFEMLTAASSVIRPGVAESGMMQEFIARHHDPSKRKYLIPEMEKYLGETYGVMIYQEDVIKVAHHIAGLSLEESDLLRRAMSGKMRSHDAMQRLENKFFTSCASRGYNNTVSTELWRQIESFAGYAFCKAHSASFALLSFQVAYLKVHYPAEFMASVLSNSGGYYSAAVYIQETRRMGITVLLPDINQSDYEYTGKQKSLRIGFMAIKNFPRNTAFRIIEERNKNGKFSSLASFIARVNTGPEETALLIKCGVMDCFGKTRPTLMRWLDIYIRYRKQMASGMNGLFASEFSDLEKNVETKDQYSISEICAIEYETFDYMVTRHPLEFFSGVINRESIIKAKDMYRYNKKEIKMVGWFMTSKRIKTKKGDIMKFLSLEDLTGTFEAVLFPETYSEYAEQTLSMGPYLLKGTVDAEAGNNLIVNKLAVLSAQDVKATARKDSSENNYYGDVEKVNPEEFSILSGLDQEKLRQAYL